MWLNFINVILVSTLILTPQVFDDKDPSDDRGENTTKRYCPLRVLDIILIDLIFVYLFIFKNLLLCHIFSCNQTVIFQNDTTWYPEPIISDCCSLYYESNKTDLRKRLEDDFSGDHNLIAIRDIAMDLLQGIM